jgi:hypothetical protein
MSHFVLIPIPPQITAAITAAAVPAAPVARILLQRSSAKAISKAIATHQHHADRVKKLKTKLQGV